MSDDYQGGNGGSDVNGSDGPGRYQDPAQAGGYERFQAGQPAQPGQDGGTRQFATGQPIQSGQPIPPAQPGGPTGPRQYPSHGEPNRPQGMSALAVSSLVLAIVAFIFSFIPLINIVTYILGAIALVLAIVGLFVTGKNHGKKGKGMAIAGVVLSILALIIPLAMGGGLSNNSDSHSKSGSPSTSQSAKKDASKDTAKEDDAAKNDDAAKTDDTAKTDTDKPKEKTITLKATATGNATATYGPAGSSSQDKFEKTWQKDITGDQANEMHSLIVMGDVMNQDPNQKVTCDVLVNGESKDHKEATGSAATVTCMSPFTLG